MYSFTNLKYSAIHTILLYISSQYPLLDVFLIDEKYAQDKARTKASSV